MKKLNFAYCAGVQLRAWYIRSSYTVRKWKHSFANCIVSFSQTTTWLESEKWWVTARLLSHWNELRPYYKPFWDISFFFFFCRHKLLKSEIWLKILVMVPAPFLHKGHCIPCMIMMMVPASFLFQHCLEFDNFDSQTSTLKWKFSSGRVWRFNHFGSWKSWKSNLKKT